MARATPVCRNRGEEMEPITGIEPIPPPWHGGMLPLDQIGVLTVQVVNAMVTFAAGFPFQRFFYGGVVCIYRWSTVNVVAAAGVAPTHARLSGENSTVELCGSTIYPVPDLNLQPSPCKGVALPVELTGFGAYGWG